LAVGGHGDAPHLTRVAGQDEWLDVRFLLVGVFGQFGRRGGQRRYLPDMRRAGEGFFLALGAAPGHGFAVRGECGETDTSNVARRAMISTGIYWRQEGRHVLAGGEIPMLDTHPNLFTLLVRDPPCCLQGATVRREQQGQEWPAE